MGASARLCCLSLTHTLSHTQGALQRGSAVSDSHTRSLTHSERFSEALPYARKRREPFSRDNDSRGRGRGRGRGGGYLASRGRGGAGGVARGAGNTCDGDDSHDGRGEGAVESRELAVAGDGLDDDDIAGKTPAAAEGGGLQVTSRLKLSMKDLEHAY